MDCRIDAHIARTQFGQSMDLATQNNERFIVDRRGEPAVIGVGFCLYIAVYNLSTYDSITNLIGVGGIAIGILPYLRTRQLARLTF